METINVKDYKGNYKKLRVTDAKIFLNKMKFDYSLENLIALITLYGLRPTRPYKHWRAKKSDLTKK